MMARFKCYLDPLYPHQKNKQTKKTVRIRSPMAKLSGSAHDQPTHDAQLHHNVTLGNVVTSNNVNCETVIALSTTQ